MSGKAPIERFWRDLRVFYDYIFRLDSLGGKFRNKRVETEFFQNIVYAFIRRASKQQGTSSMLHKEPTVSVYYKASKDRSKNWSSRFFRIILQGNSLRSEEKVTLLHEENHITKW